MPDFHHRLASLRDALLRLHKSLLDSERAVYERDIARITSPGQYLGLVMNDPFFQPLRELSGFIVILDEALSRRKDPPLTGQETDALIASARKLLVPAEHGEGFARRYFEILQRDPDAVLAHRDILASFEKL